MRINLVLWRSWSVLFVCAFALARDNVTCGGSGKTELVKQWHVQESCKVDLKSWIFNFIFLFWSREHGIPRYMHKWADRIWQSYNTQRLQFWLPTLNTWKAKSNPRRFAIQEAINSRWSHLWHNRQHPCDSYEWNSRDSLACQTRPRFGRKAHPWTLEPFSSPLASAIVLVRKKMIRPVSVWIIIVSILLWWETAMHFCAKMIPSTPCPVCVGLADLTSQVATGDGSRRKG